MGWSFRVARVLGIDVKIHVTFFLLLAWIGYMHYLAGGLPAAQEGMLFILLLFASVLLHEFGHALAARRYGIETPDITLLPIGGVARLKRMPEDPRQELVIALAGPAVNVLIALFLWIGLGYTSGMGELARLEDPRLQMGGRLLAANIILVIFNLIPAFPMDGGRVLRAVLAMRLDYVRATQIAAGVGQGMAFVFGFLGLLFNPLLIFIALFVYLGASQEAAVAQMRNVAQRLPVSAAMITEFRALPEDATVADAVELLLSTAQHEYPVLGAAGEVHGIVTRDDLIRALRQRGFETPITEVMRADVPAVSWRTPFDEAFDRMQECRCPALPVVDDDGRLVGLVTPETVGEMVMIEGGTRRRGGPTRSPDELSRT